MAAQMIAQNQAIQAIAEKAGGTPNGNHAGTGGCGIKSGAKGLQAEKRAVQVT